MKVPQPRKKQVVALPDSHEFSGFTGQVKKHANTALTVLLLIAAVVMFVRWRMRSAEMARLSIGNEVVTARTLVKDLQEFRLSGRTPADLLASLNSLQNTANSSISDVLNSSDSDPKMRAEALMLRGDLYLSLANFPPLPGASTQPSLQLSESSEALLQKAWDSYQEVIKNSTYADQHEELEASHLGLAAIAENRRDWATAKSELETVQNDPNALAVVANLGKLQLAQLPDVQKKMYVAPPTGAGPVATPISPPVPSATTLPFSVPSVIQAATQSFKP